MTMFHCRRSAFTEAELNKHAEHFWALPNSLTSGEGNARLALAWRKGGVGAVSILPVLGQFANSGFADKLALSMEEVSRLAGVDPSSACRGRDALLDLGLVEQTRVVEHFGNPVTHWTLGAALATDPEWNPMGLKDCFYFKSRVIYGGNWAQLSGVQRALYLAVATRAKAHNEEPAQNRLLRAVLPSGVSLMDFERCYDASRQDPKGPYLRLAVISLSKLSVATGVSVSALQKAADLLKHPHAWGHGTGGDTQTLLYQPLGVYPTVHGTLLYHFRDHAPHWPWSVLNPLRPLTLQVA